MVDDQGNLDLDVGPAPVSEPEIPPPPSRRLIVPGIIFLLLLAVAVGYVVRRIMHPPPAPATASSQPASKPAPPPPPEISLPPLDSSDALVRQLVGQLSSHPTVAAWLTTDGLLINFAQVTRQIANGENPMRELKPLGALPPPEVQSKQGRFFLAPSSYGRYAKYSEAISALDARGTAKLYTTLKPRITEAYRRMGDPAGDFDPVLERAIRELLEVPVIEGNVELVPKGIGYGFADPRLEKLTPAQKHLLRMGPQNVRAVQAKLREIADYLGIPASRLPAAH